MCGLQLALPHGCRSLDPSYRLCRYGEKFRGQYVLVCPGFCAYYDIRCCGIDWYFEICCLIDWKFTMMVRSPLRWCFAVPDVLANFGDDVWSGLPIEDVSLINDVLPDHHCCATLRNITPRILDTFCESCLVETSSPATCRCYSVIIWYLHTKLITL